MHKTLAQEPYTQEIFAAVGNKIARIRLTIQGTEVYAGNEYLSDLALKALSSGKVSRTSVGVGVTEATEADLLAAKNTWPGKTTELDQMISFVRASNAAEQAVAARPLQVEIVNSGDFREKDAIIRVQRDSEGKLVGATAQKI
jgi:hypothetical protein